jgi:hypothetical protein
MVKKNKYVAEKKVVVNLPISEHGKYTEMSARDRVARGGCSVGNKSITNNNPGIGTWGAIDFLTKRCGYTISQ